MDTLAQPHNRTPTQPHTCTSEPRLQVFVVVCGFIWDHLLFGAEAAPLTLLGASMLVCVPLALTDSAQEILENGLGRVGSAAESLRIECLLCVLAAPKNLALLAIALTTALVLAVVAHGNRAGLEGAL